MKYSILIFTLFFITSCSNYKTTISDESGLSELVIKYKNSGRPVVFIDGKSIDVPTRALKEVRIKGITPGDKFVKTTVNNGIHGTFTKADTLSFYPNKETVFYVENEINQYLNTLIPIVSAITGLLVSKMITGDLWKSN